MTGFITATPVELRLGRRGSGQSGLGDQQVVPAEVTKDVVDHPQAEVDWAHHEVMHGGTHSSPIDRAGAHGFGDELTQLGGDALGERKLVMFPSSLEAGQVPVELA